MILEPPAPEPQPFRERMQFVDRAVGEEVTRAVLEASYRCRPDSDLVDEDHVGVTRMSIAQAAFAPLGSTNFVVNDASNRT